MSRKFYDISVEKLINCVTGNTFFQSKVSVYMLQEMKASEA